jgi:hypothetical protein
MTGLGQPTVRDRTPGSSPPPDLTAHNVQVAWRRYAQGRPVGDDEKIRRVVQLVTDLAGVPFDRMRLLDLACLEGVYGLEFALRGAQVVGIEGREENLAKARFARDCLGLANLDLRQGDVRRVSPDREGRFDVTLCLGILYHIEDPALFDFIMTLGRMTTRLLVVDTHVALRGKTTVRWEGADWNGRRMIEHAPGSTPDQVRDRRWSSLDNPTALWLTEASLLRLLTRAGFTSIHLCKAPPEPRQPADRVTLAAIKGTLSTVLSNPWPNRLERDGFPERSSRPDPTWRGIARPAPQIGLRPPARAGASAGSVALPRQDLAAEVVDRRGEVAASATRARNEQLSGRAGRSGAVASAPGRTAATVLAASATSRATSPTVSPRRRRGWSGRRRSRARRSGSARRRSR